MSAYIARRLIIGVPVLLGVTVVVFIFVNLIPGDPATYFVNPELGGDPMQIDAVRRQLGLDQPLPLRYIKWLRQTLQGDFGYRIKNGDRVATVIWERWKATVVLVSVALGAGIFLGVSLGLFSAVRQYTVWDYLLTGLSFMGVSMPAFVVGLLGLYVLALKIPIFPVGGMTRVGAAPSLWDTAYHTVLPAMLLSLGYIAIFMRYTRFSMLEVLKQDYVRTARSKGVAERQVIRVHALRNALLPVVTAIGLNLPGLVIGAVFIETIFSWPGMGTLYLDAVQSRDYPLILAMNVVIGTAILVANLVTDIAYAWIDPRIRYD